MDWYPRGNATACRWVRYRFSIRRPHWLRCRSPYRRYCNCCCSGRRYGRCSRIVGQWYLCWKVCYPPPESCRTKFPSLPLCRNLLQDYKLGSVNQIFRQFNLQNVRAHSDRPATKGPCVGNGRHINLRFLQGGGRAGSITSCNCCDDSSGTPQLKTLFRMIPWNQFTNHNLLDISS